MRQARRALLLAAGAALLALCVGTDRAGAAPQYWDTDGTVAGNNATTGTGLGGTGNWSTAVANWWDGGAPGTLAGWAEGNDAFFLGTAGIVTLSGPRTANSVTFGSTGYTITASTLTLTGAANIDVQVGTGSMATVLAGAVGFTKAGPGTLLLAASSTATGNRRITGGTLSIDTALRIPNNGTVTLDGGALVQTNPTSAGSYLQASTALDIGSSGGTVSYSGAAGSVTIYTGTIRGIGNTLTKAGSGEFRVQGANTASFTFGKLKVVEGLYRIGATTPTNTSVETGFGAAPAAFTPDAITLDNGAIGASFGVSLHPNRGITLGSGGGSINVSAGAMTVPSQISDGPGAGPLNLVGTTATQLLTLSNPANQIASGIIIRGGRLNVTATGASGIGNILFDTGANAGGLSNNATSLVEINNPVLTLGGSAGTPEIGAASNFTLQINSQITGTRPFQKTSGTGNGTLVLTNSANDFTGAVTVSAGRLAITANNALGAPAGGTTVNNGTAILVMRGGFDYTTPEPLTIAGSASNAGVIQNTADSNRFAGPITMTGASTVGVNAGELELAGPIGGAFQLAKVGPGALTLSNAGNTFTSLAVSAGTLVVGDDAHLGTVPAAPLVNNVELAGGALRTSAGFTLNPNRGILLVGTDSKIDAPDGVTFTVPGAIAGGTLNKTGAGSLVLSGTKSHTATNIDAGTLSLAPGAVLPGNVVIAPGGALHGSGSVGGNVTVNGTVSPGHGPGTLHTAGDHTWAGGGAYEFEIDDATGTAGVDWDQMTMNAVTVSATSSNRFVIRIVALPGAGGPGLDNFNPDAAFSWKIAVAASGEVTSFDLTKFEIDVTQFEQNNQNKGGFYVSRGFKGELMLNYVPEPGPAVLIALGAAANLLRRRQRRA